MSSTRQRSGIRQLFALQSPSEEFPAGCFRVLYTYFVVDGLLVCCAEIGVHARGASWSYLNLNVDVKAEPTETLFKEWR